MLDLLQTQLAELAKQIQDLTVQHNAAIKQKEANAQQTISDYRIDSIPILRRETITSPTYALSSRYADLDAIVGYRQVKTPIYQTIYKPEDTEKISTLDTQLEQLNNQKKSITVQIDTLLKPISAEQPKISTSTTPQLAATQSLSYDPIVINPITERTITQDNTSGDLQNPLLFLIGAAVIILVMLKK